MCCTGLYGSRYTRLQEKYKRSQVQELYRYMGVQVYYSGSGVA